MGEVSGKVNMESESAGMMTATYRSQKHRVVLFVPIGIVGIMITAK